MFSTYSQYLRLVLHYACSASAINRVHLIPLQSWLWYHCPFQLIYNNITSVELLQIYSSATEKSGAALIKAKIKRWKQLGNALVRLLQSSASAQSLCSVSLPPNPIHPCPVNLLPPCSNTVVSSFCSPCLQVWHCSPHLLREEGKKTEIEYLHLVDSLNFKIQYKS